VDTGSSCLKACGVYFLLQICCLQGIAGVSLRKKIRRAHDLQGRDINACLSYTVCPCLSVVQDSNEHQMQADAVLRSAPRQQQMTT
jgi:Cys-rich protein (TIGR01571 family)